MSSNKILNVQIINAHDTESNWKQVENDFVPFDGEMIVYSPDATHTNSRIKIGNGKDNLAKLNFFTGNIIKTKTAPGANNINTQNIYQVVDNNDEVVSYWYYSHGEWCELGTGNTGEASKSMINTTHSDLVSLRDSASLVPGQLYRITDYQCTTTQENTSSAGHQFDIIVRADSERLLNENAWATYHYNEDGAVDGYFQEKIKILEEATLKEGVVLENMTIIGKSMEDSAAEIDYGGVGDTWSWKEDDYLTTWISPKYGFEVPAIFDPDPDQSGADCVYVYEDTLNMPIDNSLVKLRYVLSDIETESIYHDEDSIRDYYNDVIVDFKYDEDDCPVIYKTQSFAYIATDYEDKFIYEGEYEFNGNTYSMWIKRDSDGDGSGHMWLTDSIVSNGKFIYSIDELKAAVVYRVVDKWVEYLAQGMIFNQCVRFTDNVVNATGYSQIKQNANLAAWELKYSLNNNANRFYWVDVENGRGVIYYMKDEYNNECPYDFKNILFNGKYTFNWSASPAGWDLSIWGNNGKFIDSLDSTPGVYENTIKPFISDYQEQKLNNIVFDGDLAYDGGYCYGYRGNHFDFNCHDIYFGDDCQGNTFGANCHHNTLEDGCRDNVFKANCYDNVLGMFCHSIVFDNSCRNNTLEESCAYIKFSVGCMYVNVRGQSSRCTIEYLQGSPTNPKYIQTTHGEITIVRSMNVREVFI